MADILTLNADEKDIGKVVAAVRQLVERFQPSEDLASASEGALIAANNLSDLANAATARTNLGVVAKAGDTMTGALVVQIGTAITQADYLELKPTDFAVGKPYLFFQKTTTADRWNIGLWDGSGTGGTIDIAVTNFTHNGNAIIDTATLPSSTAPTRQYLTSGTAATYTTPANCKKIIIKMIGGGGGGGAATTNAGATGGTTTFNSVNAAGGNGGTQGSVSTNTNGGTGGSGGTGSASLRLTGSAGGYGFGTIAIGGFGAPGIFGTGGTRSTIGVGGGSTASANTGAGGGGGSAGAVTGEGGGGGAGEYVELEILTPAATYTYTVGGGGAGGSAGSQAGGNGGTGLIIVEEYY